MSSGNDTTVETKTEPVTLPPQAGDIQKEKCNDDISDEASEAVNWWSGWGSTQKWAKTLTDVGCNVTKSMTYGFELANQVLDKEIEIEIDVDKVTEKMSNLATKTVSQSKKIIEKSSGVVDESLKYVEKGVHLVTEDVHELSQALVEDTQAGYTAITSVTYNTLEKVGGQSTADKAVKVKDSIFGGINAFASAILADSDTDSESNTEARSRKILKGPEARLNQLRISPATYCNEPEDMSDFLSWLINFDLESEKTKAEISDLLVETPQVRSLYSKLVPEAVTYSDFWQRYYYRLHLFDEAEMRRSRLVERANTEDEDEELDSWGSDSDSDVATDNLEPNIPVKKNDDIGPTGKNDSEDETGLDNPTQEDTKKDKSTPKSLTPQSCESKESEWTNVDRSESDDWEKEFDIQEIKKNETKPTETTAETETNEAGDDWDDWD